VIGATVALLRSSLTLRRFVSLLLMLLLRGLLMVLLCRLLLLTLLARLRPALFLTLLLMLCVGRGSGSEKQEENCCTDDASSLHLSVLLLNASCPLTLSP
jgi:hypothetical protein